MDVATHSPHFFQLGRRGLPAVLRMPDRAHGIVVFAHGSGSSHRSPRNNYVAEALGDAGLATLLFDLLTVDEERNRANIFDIALLSSRLIEAVREMRLEPACAHLPIGLFGASTGAGAALYAAGQRPELFGAVVSRGGRPDLAGRDALEHVRAPTQLIVGGADTQVIALNEAAARHLRCPHELVIVKGAGHLFEEPGALAEVIAEAKRWFLLHLAGRREP
ncbi:dienelactone hydrolase family protein [Croceicoccus mobilis]|uniref:Dienelactone hydrolase domain-containing protein n=1 Tax=Croceicoccus mobilis TaxID=1703339 RepID=A0A917DVR5_9SPHN|nr:dienelactone hydrolase family protein [Croceicoccus mobilis]GGD75792.1 hypothetical protein GCM10010990_26740 [Croceicoccus mobilis]